MVPGFVVDSVWKAFADRAVLKGAFAWAVPGRVTLLLGSNGSGKSTLLRCCTGLLRWDQGACFIQGKFVRPHLPSLAARGVFYWPDAGLLSRRRTIGWHLAAVRRSLPPAPTSDLPGRCAALLPHRPDAVSGGELRRCELAVVLEASPRFLLADEPLLASSPRDRAELCSALRAHADRGAAVLATGHEVEDLLDIADDVIWMSAGRTRHLGTPADARTNWHFRRDYLAGRARS